MEGEAACGVQEPVAQALGFAARELAVEAERLAAEEELLGAEHELEPDGVGVEVAEGEVGQAAVLGGADAVLDTCAGAMGALQDGDLGAVLVGEDRLETVAVMVGEAQLRAGMRALPTNDHPGISGPGGQVEQVGDLGDLPVLARLPVLVERRLPGILGQGEDRRPDGLSEVKPDREADARVTTCVEQLVGGGGPPNRSAA